MSFPFEFGDRIEKIRTAYNWTQVQSSTLSVSTDYLLSLDDREYIEFTGLTKIQKAHIQQLIHDLQEKETKLENV